MQKQNSKTIIGFQFSQLVDTLHPDECLSVSYMGRAEITEEFHLEEEERLSSFLDVKILDLWMGVDVPSDWKPFRFRKVSVPDGRPRFYGLVSELETAAIDQYHSPVPVALPDEIPARSEPVHLKHDSYSDAFRSEPLSTQILI